MNKMIKQVDSIPTDEIAGRTEATPSDAVLVARGLSKRYRVPDGERLVLESIDLEVRRGELVSIVGPSGAGKTTLLRCLSGLLPPSSGYIELAGHRITRPPEGLSVVFQDYSRSLLPWMTVEANVILPLRSKGLSKKQCQTLAQDSLAAVGLSHATKQYSWQLSGGMQQRVAIARALAYEPTVLLTYSPTSKNCCR